MDRPKLRRLERYRLDRDDEQLLVLRDPLELCEPFAVDAEFTPVLDALDGQRSLAQIRQSLMMRGVLEVDAEDLQLFVEDLAEAGLLDDEHFRARWSVAHDDFLDQEQRLPRRAGLLYPEDPGALARWLAPALPGQEAPSAEASADAPPLAIVTPHQPPPLVADGLRRLLGLLPDPARYRRVVILATDHSPGLLPYASADKDWVTPLGLVPADLELLAALDERVPWLLREQIRLRASDPLEWTTLLLRALWGERCPPVLPIACGQTRLTTRDGRDQADELVGALETLLGPATAAGEVLWWTAAELSHIGPAFGHPELPAREAVEAEDRAILAPLLDGRPGELVRRCMERPSARWPSGAAALATLAELLPLDARASLIDYQVLEAPGDRPGWIGAAALAVRAQQVC
ncbi:AmmeMemoRadiSam system protein B [Pseudenhygromyxa sp. WMMC2535]|nr:AmmeMemoRadiSam system protein B [Pseudenhygromyxa sp. WMMC2535]